MFIGTFWGSHNFFSFLPSIACRMGHRFINLLVTLVKFHVKKKKAFLYVKKKKRFYKEIQPICDFNSSPSDVMLVEWVTVFSTFTSKRKSAMQLLSFYRPMKWKSRLNGKVRKDVYI